MRIFNITKETKVYETRGLLVLTSYSFRGCTSSTRVEELLRGARQKRAWRRWLRGDVR
jgi:predicted nucleic acid-binding protein